MPGAASRNKELKVRGEIGFRHFADASDKFSRGVREVGVKVRSNRTWIIDEPLTARKPIHEQSFIQQSEQTVAVRGIVCQSLGDVDVWRPNRP